MAKEEKGLLENFEFDSINANDFFGVPNTAVEEIVDSKVKQKTKESNESEETDSTIDEVEEEITDDDFSFSNEEEVEESTTKKSHKEESKSQTKSDSSSSKVEKEVEIFSNLAEDLKEAGVFSLVEFGEDEEITSDVFFEKFAEEVDNRVDNTIQSLMDSLDEDGAAFLKFKSNGGNTSDFFKVYGKMTELPVSDVDSEENQKAFLEYYYSENEDLDREEIEERLDRYIESGKLERYAKQYFNKTKEAKDAEQQALVERQNELKKQQQEQNRQFQSNLKSVISKEKEINDFPIDSKKDGFLVDFLTKPVLDKDTNSYMTSFQKSMRNIFADEKKLILLAKLVANDFDFSSIKKKGETTATKKTLNTLKTKRQFVNSGEGKRLADYFN